MDTNGLKISENDGQVKKGGNNLQLFEEEKKNCQPRLGNLMIQLCLSSSFSFHVKVHS